MEEIFGDSRFMAHMATLFVLAIGMAIAIYCGKEEK